MSSSYLDRCCELQQDPILSSRERSESRLINPLTLSVGLIQIINAAGAECAGLNLIPLLVSLKNAQTQNTGLKYWEFYLKAIHMSILGSSNKELTQLTRVHTNVRLLKIHKHRIC